MSATPSSESKSYPRKTSGAPPPRPPPSRGDRVGVVPAARLEHLGAEQAAVESLPDAVGEVVRHQRVCAGVEKDFRPGVVVEAHPVVLAELVFEEHVSLTG